MATRKKRAHREPADVLAWRRRTKPGKIMKPTTFERIVRKSMARYGISRQRAKSIAGRAYWRTVEARYKKSKYRHAKHARPR